MSPRPILLFLIALDAVLSVVAFFFPAFWGQAMHGVDTWNDPYGLFTRLGSVWLAFLVLQVIALLRYEREPYWLAVIAGVRWTELWADGVYWFKAPTLTWFGHAGLLSSPPANFLFGLLLLRAMRRAYEAHNPLGVDRAR